MPHHVTQRGNRRNNVFFTDADRQKYLALLKKYSKRYRLKIIAYCLMTNHVHLVVIPMEERSLGCAMRDVQKSYATYLNHRTGQTGHVWQRRYYSTVLDEDHLWTAIRYVEQNPVRARMVKRPEDYPWSSAAARCGLRTDPLLAQDFPVNGLIPDWSAWLREPTVDSREDAVRRHTSTGRPCGSSRFVSEVEARLGRDLAPRRRGPKPKVGSGNSGTDTIIRGAAVPASFGIRP